MNPIFSGLYFKTIAKAADATKPDTLTYATIGDADTLDPALSYDTASGEVVQNVYETLVFYDGAATDKFVGQLATDWTVSEDGTVWTFHIRPGVKFHEGGDLTPSDVAYTFQRGLLQGGYSSPQWMLAEPFLGVGIDDITLLVDDSGALGDDREGLIAADPAKLVAVRDREIQDCCRRCRHRHLHPGSAWGPFLPTIANGWGSIMDKEWVIEKGGWDGSCETWQNTYGMTSAEDIFSTIANGTGAYALDHWTQGTEIVLKAFDGYWGEHAKVPNAVIAIIPEFGTRFAMLQAGDIDFMDVPVEQRPQVDPMVSEAAIYDAETNAYKDPVPVCKD